MRTDALQQLSGFFEQWLRDNLWTLLIRTDPSAVITLAFKI